MYHYVSLASRMKAKRSSHIPPSTHIARSSSSTFPKSKDRVKGGKGSLPPFLPTFIPSSLELGKFDTKFNGLISTGRWRHDRPRQAERASERRLLRRTTAAAAPENGILNFSPFLRLMPSSAPSVEKNLNQQKEGEGHDRRRWREGKNGIVSHRRISVMYSSLGKESFNPY